MRASEILRKLADMIDATEGGQSSQMGSSPETSNHAELTAVSVDHTDDTEKGGTFVPPLQAKIELLKKSVDVDSVYDQQGPDEQLTGHGSAFTVVWPASFRCPNGTAPTLTSTLNKVDTIVAYTRDGGTNWFAYISGQNS